MLGVPYDEGQTVIGGYPRAPLARYRRSSTGDLCIWPNVVETVGRA
jgi:hypothetical protein